VKLHAPEVAALGAAEKRHNGNQTPNGDTNIHVLYPAPRPSPLAPRLSPLASRPSEYENTAWRTKRTRNECNAEKGTRSLQALQVLQGSTSALKSPHIRVARLPPMVRSPVSRVQCPRARCSVSPCSRSCSCSRVPESHSGGHSLIWHLRGCPLLPARVRFVHVRCCMFGDSLLGFCFCEGERGNMLAFPLGPWSVPCCISYLSHRSHATVHPAHPADLFLASKQPRGTEQIRRAGTEDRRTQSA
jgi:hypothetical protein